MQIRSPKHKKVPVVCHITTQTGLARSKSSSVKALWVSSRIILLRCDVANTVSLLESRLSQIGRVAIDVGGAGDCFFRPLRF